MAKQYFAIIDDEQRGPFRLEQLAEAGVMPDTFVWTKGMDDWAPARDDAEIARYFRRRLANPGGPIDPEEQRQRERERAESEYEQAISKLPPRFQNFVRKAGVTPGEPLNTEPDIESRPPSLVVWAILATIFCCPLSGIVAIVMAVKATSSWNAGEKKKAWDYTRLAKLWTGLTFFFGFILAALLMTIQQ